MLRHLLNLTTALVCLSPQASAQVVIAVEDSGLFVNGRLISPNMQPLAIKTLLGSPSRETELGTMIYDDQGLAVLTSSSSNPRREFVMMFIQKYPRETVDKKYRKYYPKEIFTGQFLVNGKPFHGLEGVGIDLRQASDTMGSGERYVDCTQVCEGRGRSYYYVTAVNVPTDIWSDCRPNVVFFMDTIWGKSREMNERYLTKYPAGRYAPKARTIMESECLRELERSKHASPRQQQRICQECSPYGLIDDQQSGLKSACRRVDSLVGMWVADSLARLETLAVKRRALEALAGIHDKDILLKWDELMPCIDNGHEFQPPSGMAELEQFHSAYTLERSMANNRFARQGGLLKYTLMADGEDIALPSMLILVSDTTYETPSSLRLSQGVGDFVRLSGKGWKKSSGIRPIPIGSSLEFSSDPFYFYGLTLRNGRALIKPEGLLLIAGVEIMKGTP